jgi:hypothetical protein
LLIGVVGCPALAKVIAYLIDSKVPQPLSTSKVEAGRDLESFWRIRQAGRAAVRPKGLCAAMVK